MLFAMLFPAPAAPAFAPRHTTTAEFHPRYEDCIQDGRLTALAIPPALAAIWNARDVTIQACARLAPLASSRS